MKLSDIAALRLRNQGIVGRKFKSPEEAVKHLGAIQAQDYRAALWALGLRSEKSTEEFIEKAITTGKIIRTWPMRGTLHFVAAEDARWMLELLTPKVMGGYALRHARFGITDKILDRCRFLIGKALKGNKSLSRPELYNIMEQDGITTANSRGLHILGRIAHDRLICFGPRRGSEHTFVLFDEWIPKGKKVSREKALAEVVVRYFSGHGPATIRDLMWWSGLSGREIKEGIQLAGSKLKSEEVEGRTYWMVKDLLKSAKNSGVHLLPAFDEYFVGYKDRDAVLEKIYAERINPGANGMLNPVIVSDGQIIGTWRRIVKKDLVFVNAKPFKKFTDKEKAGIKKAAADYARFLDKKLAD